MAGRDDVRRGIAICEECGSSYAARVWPDGTLKLIGREDCSCGSSAFRIVDDTASDESDSGATGEDD